MAGVRIERAWDAASVGPLGGFSGSAMELSCARRRISSSFSMLEGEKDLVMVLGRV